MKAKVKATGKVITVRDMGEKFHPRYWDKKNGYDAKEITFIKEAPKFSETNLATWTLDQLKKRAIGLHSAIYQTECFGSQDMLELDAIEAELNHRGYEFQESKTLSIVKG